MITTSCFSIRVFLSFLFGCTTLLSTVQAEVEQNQAVSESGGSTMRNSRNNCVLAQQIIDAEELRNFKLPTWNFFENWTNWESWEASAETRKYFPYCRSGYDEDGLVGKLFPALRSIFFKEGASATC